jgi:mannose-6-phosphate isomerase-like protein (cupin superfamily)
MSLVRLVEFAQQLPSAWSSRLIAKFGSASLKLLRMDGSPYAQECHDYAEGLLVLEGELLLQVAGKLVRVGAGEIYTVPAGVPHGVGAGSYGSLLILDN